LKYDAWITNLNAWIEASTGIPISNSQLEGGTIQQVCAVTQQRCTGSNTQWSSVNQCVSVLSQKPYGNYDETWGDNIVCRTIHLVLTQVRPDVSSLASSAFFAPQHRHWIVLNTGPLPPRGTYRRRQVCGLCIRSGVLRRRGPLWWSARRDVQVSLKPELSKISKHRIVLEKDWKKWTIVMLPSVAGVLLFEISISWMWAFWDTMWKRESDISGQLMIVLLPKHQQMLFQNFLHSLWPSADVEKFIPIFFTSTRPLYLIRVWFEIFSIICQQDAKFYG
jgi:hypothetical protein